MTEKTSTQKRGITWTLIGIVCVVTLFLSLFFNKMLSPRIISTEELMVNGAVEFEKPRIIKPFGLLDQSKRAFTNQNLESKWTLMFFGFTTCPDICPMTLATMSRVYNALDEDIRAQTQVVLLSVDPERDTPETLSKYVTHFNAEFIGVTGEFISIKRFGDNVNVAFNKVMLDEGYTVDHSGNIVLINPYGHYHGFFRPPFELARLKLTYQSIVTSFSH